MKNNPGSDWDTFGVEDPPKTNGKDHKPPPQQEPPPRVYNCEEVLAIETPTEEMLFEGYPIPARGATLKVGAARSGKTLLAVQEAIAVASGKPLFDYYRVLTPGPVLIVEQDDPGGASSIKTIIERSGITKGSNLPLHVATGVNFGFGLAMLDWLEEQIERLSLRMIVLDSYTALRGPHQSGGDIVKTEQLELTALDELAKRRAMANQIIHHGSKTAASKSLDWTMSAAGTFVMGAATEAQVHLQRFSEMDSAATERLIRIRGRHSADVQMVLKFRKETLNFEWILEGSAASFYPLIQQIQLEFKRQAFDYKELMSLTGASRSTTFRQLNQLQLAGVLNKTAHGKYILTV
jgi:RecA-family ATPase